MKKLRKVIFWCHLPVGVIAGIVILNMCVTGVLLTYEKQITSWANTRGYHSVPPSTQTQHLPVETLIAQVRNTRGVTPTSVTLKADPSAPAEFGFGRETTLFVNPYTGTILKGDNRNVARAITSACNLGFLFLVISGFFLWWPRNWNLRSVRNVIWFRRRLPAKTRDFNWHNTIGFWSAVPLFIVVLSAVVISYSWAGNLVYRIVGETPPPPRSSQPTPSSPSKDQTTTLNGLNAAWVRAAQQVSNWQSITLQLPASASSQLTFNIDQGSGGQPQKRGQLVLDRITADVVRWEPFSAYSRGRQLRSILRFAHTGEVAGIFGQTIAGLVSTGGAVLVFTGLALAMRRFLAWVAKRSKSSKPTLADVARPIPNSTGD